MVFGGGNAATPSDLLLEMVSNSCLCDRKSTVVDEVAQGADAVMRARQPVTHGAVWGFARSLRQVESSLVK